MTSTPPDMRSVARDAVRRRISDLAIELFAEHGFDTVTVEQVAEAAGVSTRSVHRHFVTKEDLVIGLFEANGAIIHDALVARPADERPMTSLRAAYEALLTGGHDRPSDRNALRLIATTSTLRARNSEKALAWSALLAPVVSDRLSGDDTLLRAHVIVEASLAAFQNALMAWADDPRHRTMVEMLTVAFADLDASAGS